MRQVAQTSERYIPKTWGSQTGTNPHKATEQAGGVVRAGKASALHQDNGHTDAKLHDNPLPLAWQLKLNRKPRPVAIKDDQAPNCLRNLIQTLVDSLLVQIQCFGYKPSPGMRRHRWCLLALAVALVASASAQFGGRGGPAQPEATAVKSDIKYIKCEVCQLVAKHAYRQVKAAEKELKPGKKVTSYLALLIVSWNNIERKFFFITGSMAPGCSSH